MKSKEFIKLLQEIDPTGEAHIRGFGGAIVSAYMNPGYYDGSYSYMDGDVYVSTRKDSKIDVVVYDIDSIIERYHGDMDKIKEHVRFDSYTDKCWENIEKQAREYRDLKQRFLNEATFEVLKKYQQGLQVAQSIKDKIGHYNVMWWHEDGSTQINRMYSIGNCNGLNQGQCGAIIKSGFFTPVQEGEIYVWKLNLK